MSGGPTRSTGLLLVALLLALAAGGAAALLKGRLSPPISPKPELRRGAQPGPDPRAMNERQLELLIQDAALAEDVTALPSFGMFQLLWRRSPGDFTWVIDRLAEPGVPEGLAFAFAERLPRKRREADVAARRLLLPGLMQRPAAAQWMAIKVLRAREEAALNSWAACGCLFGVVPRSSAGEGRYLFALPADEGRSIAWDPTSVPDAPGVVDLGLRAGPIGQPPVPLLLRSWDGDLSAVRAAGEHSARVLLAVGR